jgi:hypothetical protein
MLNNIKEITGRGIEFRKYEKWYEVLPHGLMRAVSEESIKSYLVGCIHMGYKVRTEGCVLYVS